MATQTGEEPGIEEEAVEPVEDPITGRAILSAIVGGVAGLIAMLPIAAGLPVLLGLFTLKAPVGFAFMVFATPSPTLGALFFVIGGIAVLPLFFIVTATFLPPKSRPYLRGIPMATIFWPGFVIAFWPASDAMTNLAFLGISLVSHWIYGLVMGSTLQYFTGIPEHDL